MKPGFLCAAIFGSCLAVATTAAGNVRADEWAAIVIGQPGQGAQTAFADAFHAADALAAGGGRDVVLLRDAGRSDLQASLAAKSDIERLILYIAAPLTPDGRAFQMRDGAVGFDELLGQAQAAGAGRLALLVENCANRDGPAAMLADLDAPAQSELYVAASAAPGSACPVESARLTAKLRAASGTATTLQEALRDSWTRSTLTDPVAMTVAAPTPAPATPSAAPIVSVVSNDVVALTPVVTPQRSAAPLAPVAPTPAAASGTGSPSDTVLIFNPPPSSQIAAIPRAAGLPEPSIIVGIIEGVTNAAFDRAEDPGEVDGTEIAYDNLEARRGLQAQDPDLFESLVSAGAFDPPAPLMERALQTELARMGCYTAAIDGIWGNGSRAAVSRYFEERPGAEPVTLEPEARLFRQIILQDDITCEAPQVSARPAASSPSAGTTTRSTPARQSAPARQAAPAPRQQAPANNTRRIQTGTTLGIFR